MKKLLLLNCIIIAICIFISCGTDTPTIAPITPDFNYSLSSNTLDFGYSAITKSVNITIDSNNSLNWRAYNNNSNRWFEYDYLEGVGNKTLNIKILRSKLSFGKNIDTLFFVASIPPTFRDLKGNKTQSKDSIRTLIIIAYKNPTVLEAFTSQVQNQVLILKPYYDTTFSFIGTYRVDNLGTVNNFGIANFVGSGKIFADAGSAFSLTSYNNSQTTSPVNIDKKTFTFFSDSSNSFNANFYCSMLTNNQIQFDSNSTHRFTIAGGMEYTLPFADGIRAVDPIVCFPEPSTITISSAPMSVYWNPTSASDDSVYVVLVSKSDKSFTATSAKPVNDNVGATKIPPANLARAKAGNSKVTVWIIRYRNRIDATNKRIYVCQSQKSYEITLN